MESALSKRKNWWRKNEAWIPPLNIMSLTKLNWLAKTFPMFEIIFFSFETLFETFFFVLKRFLNPFFFVLKRCSKPFFFSIFAFFILIATADQFENNKIFIKKCKIFLFHSNFFGVGKIFFKFCQIFSNFLQIPLEFFVFFTNLFNFFLTCIFSVENFLDGFSVSVWFFFL